MENKDIRLMIGDVKFSCRAVAVIENEGKILFQKRVGDPFWALPGGAIATMEKGSEVVLREIEEETGEKNAEVVKPLWFSEYFFKIKEQENHQYILGYLVKLPEESELINKEEFDGIEPGKNIIYKWIDRKEISTSAIKPDSLKETLPNINNNFTFISETEE